MCTVLPAGDNLWQQFQLIFIEYILKEGEMELTRDYYHAMTFYEYKVGLKQKESFHHV